MHPGDAPSFTGGIYLHVAENPVGPQPGKRNVVSGRLVASSIISVMAGAQCGMGRRLAMGVAEEAQCHPPIFPPRASAVAPSSPPLPDLGTMAQSRQIGG